jgi:hypothetical protein
MRPTLAFTPRPNRVVVRSPSGLEIVDVTGAAAPRSIVASSIEDFAVIGDQIWIAEGGVVPALRRVSLDGEPIGERTPLWGLPGAGRLVRVPFGGTAALWTAAPASVLVASGGKIDTAPVVGDAELVLPVSPSRWLVCTRNRVTLREPTAERWSTGMVGPGTILGGAVLLDGRAAALLLDVPASEAHPDGARQLVVIGLHQPVVQHRLTIAHADLVRFATVRGLAAVVAARRRLLLIDLRFGRLVKEHAWHRDVVDLAIDDTGQHVALRLDGTGEVLHVAVADLVAAPPPQAEEGEGGAGEAAEAAADAEPLLERSAARREAAPAPPSTAPFHRGPSLGAVLALAPRPAPSATSPAESIALLERYRTLTTALVERAIALSWDEGRLTYPNEGSLPFASEVEGLVGRSSGGRATDALRTADAHVAEALATVRAAEASLGARVPPLAALAQEFRLSGLARRILLCVAGPALWGSLARLYGILGNDEGRPLCDEMLVGQILGPRISSHEIGRELDRGAPLIRYGLVRPGDGRMRPFVALTVEPVVLRILRGAASDDELEGVEVVRPEVAFEDLLIPAAVKESIVQLLGAPQAEARVAIRGRVGSGRHTLLATLAAAAGRRLGIIDATQVVRDLRNRLEQLRGAMMRANLLGLLPCIDGLETLASDDLAGRDVIRECLRQHPGPLAVRLPWDAQAPLDPGHLAIDLPALSIDQRLTTWKTVLERHQLYVREPLELATRYSVGPGVVVQACARVAGASAARPPADGAARDVAPELETAVRQHLESRLGTTATRITRLTTWSQVVLPPDIQDSLLELIARIRHRRTVYDVWGFDQVISTSRGVTALFQGGPGTGKTLVAGAIANELGMDLYRVDLSRIMSKWIGETEQNLAKLFDAAEDGHAIILFDEADSLFAKRTEVRTSVDRYANLEVNYLLQRFDSFEGIAILTTNFGTAIDAAFKRRLSFRLTFPFPDEEMREQIWRAHLPADIPKAGEFDLAELARRYRMSGGYIRNATLRAAFLAAEEQTPLTQAHLERAIRAEFREIGKLGDSGVLE